MFKDATSAKSNLRRRRFLYAAVPKGNEVELDFNKAHNPPCAFTAVMPRASAAAETEHTFGSH